MTFHELVMVWYPRAMEARKARQDDMVNAIVVAFGEMFGGKRS